MPFTPLQINNFKPLNFSSKNTEPSALYTGDIFANTPEAANARKDTAFIGGGNNFIKNDIKGAFQSGIGQVKAGYNQAKNATNPLQLLEGGVKEAAGGINALFSPLAPVFSPVGKAINYVANKVSDIPIVQKFAMSPTGMNVARGAEDVGNLATITQAVAGIEGGVPKVTDVGRDLGNKILETPTKIKDAYINNEKINWEKPTTKTVPAYNKATEIFNFAKNKGTDIGQVLLDNKIKLSDNVETGATGKQVYSTAETAQKIRSDAMKLSTDLVRPALQEFDQAHPPIEGKFLKDKAIENINSNRSLTSGDKLKLINDIKKEPLGKSYTKEGLLDEKIVRDQNAKYSPVGDIATNSKAAMNKAIADASRYLLEKDLSKEVPIHEVNGEASKLYQTAEYLDALNGKPVPRGIISRIASGATKIVGAGIGESIGGPLAGLAGYHLGGVFERAFENMPDPVKSSILNSLEKKQPKIFDALTKYIGDNETARLTRKALPSGGYISLGPETPKPQTAAELLPAKKYPTSMNPKSGKFQKVYSSSPK